MARMKKGIGIRQETASQGSRIYNKGSRFYFWNSGKANLAIATIFLVFFGLAILFSLFPIFSVKYRLADSSFDKSLEQKIIEDMYSEINNTGSEANLPFGEVKEFKTIDSMEESIKSELDGLSGKYGIYIKNLKDGSGVRINAEEPFTAASLSKLFVAGAYYNRLMDEPFFGSSGFELQKKDMVAGNGAITAASPGMVFEKEKVVHEMLNQSDNSALTLIARKVGLSEIEEFIKKNGFSKTNFRKNDTSPEDVGTLFEKIFLDDILSSDFKGDFLESLDDTVSEDRIPYYIPSNIKISHKIGTWDGVYSDAGIVFAKNGEFIIVVMNEKAEYTEAVNFTRKLSKLVYDYFEMVNAI